MLAASWSRSSLAEIGLSLGQGQRTRTASE